MSNSYLKVNCGQNYHYFLYIHNKNNDKMLSDTSTIIANVGIMVVISALFIILFYKQYTQMQHFLKHHIENLENQATNAKKEHAKGMQMRDYATDRILDLIKELAHKVGAIRSYVFELHNSINNMTGLPFSKVTMNYEFFEKGEQPVIHKYQSLPSSTVSQVIFKLYTNPYVFIYDNSKCGTDMQSISWFLGERGAKSVIFFPLKSSAGQIFGIVGFDFTDVQNPIDWSDERIFMTFRESIAHISGLLDYKRNDND